MNSQGQSTSNSSTSSFVDAPDASDTLNTVEVTDDRDTLREEPLSTPNVSQIQSSDADQTIKHDLDDDEEQKKNVVTIFDVATEIETMLNDIVCITKEIQGEEKVGLTRCI
ncbi:hypothetical protein BN7_3642 [Wickerhamomyces ciferrii]|uniref:Uncharacterized protein n=1 Tax=Wickerhamomyces ciferrii (strain ATCC 14091 / BCRC 22168 / CBS 111 / JCM 3599 / NBRC 0793 / NRRL Y-1031 F-60-10) TaxID=1206466 RepID=K0KRW4_WICCF|nr:uncharacterized protein BN7_3642 [Wickerhamomyces ciferrii]CCH44083.1 hypothetical protein BN7_3642 [Wickerhamomyces ciferrii]